MNRFSTFAIAIILVSLILVRPVAASDAILEFEKLLGAQIASALRGNSGVDEDPLLTDWVQRVGRAVAAPSPRQDVPYSFTILGTDAANALAAPAGYVFVTRGLLDTIESDDELAVVMAHEVGHVTKHHAMQQIGGNALATVLISSLRGNRNRGLRTALSLGNVLRTLHKSREMESQADEEGLAFAAEAGYDAGGLISFFEGFDLNERSLLEEYFNTHPAPAKRKAAAEKSPYVLRRDIAVREATARGLTGRGLLGGAEAVRRGTSPLLLPPLPPVTIPPYLTEERDQIYRRSHSLRRRLLKGYRAQDVGGTLKQVLLINNQIDPRWLYIAGRAYAIQAEVEDIFARTGRVAAIAPGTYDALAGYADRPPGDAAALEGGLGRGELRRALEKAEGAPAPLERAARAVTTVLVDLNNRFLRLNNEATWLRYAALEGLLRYAESELARADRASGQAWRLLSLARVRRYQQWLTDTIPESDAEKRALWISLTQRRFGAWFPTQGTTGEATVRAALAIQKREAAFAVANERGTSTWADWALEKKGIPENIATAMRLLVFDLDRELTARQTYGIPLSVREQP